MFFKIKARLHLSEALSNKTFIVKHLQECFVFNALFFLLRRRAEFYLFVKLQKKKSPGERFGWDDAMCRCHGDGLPCLVSCEVDTKTKHGPDVKV